MGAYKMIYVTSLNEYRLNKVKVGYLMEELIKRGYECEEYSYQVITEEDIVLVINAVDKINTIRENDLSKSKAEVVYLVNDTKTYYPVFPSVILSQFKNDTRAVGFIDLASLHLLGEKYKNTCKTDTLIYWGHFKEERRDGYIHYLPNNPNTVIIGDKKEWRGTHPNCTFIPYIRDLDLLYQTIAKNGTKTIMIGDPKHNGVNVASRYYEALNCGLEVYWDKDLLGDQIPSTVVTLGNLTSYLPSISETPREVDIDSLSGEELVIAKGTSYGNYGDGVECRGSILEALEDRYFKYHGRKMPDTLRIPLTDISIKLSRMMSDPGKEDNYKDLIGYSILLKEVAYDGK